MGKEEVDAQIARDELQMGIEHLEKFAHDLADRGGKVEEAWILRGALDALHRYGTGEPTDKNLKEAVPYVRFWTRGYRRMWNALDWGED